MTYDLIMQGVTLVLVIYFGLHLRTQLRVVKSTVEVQEKAIAAQAEHMKALQAMIQAQAEQLKAQSTLLQDAERSSKMMQQVVDIADPETTLKRMQSYKKIVDLESQAVADYTAKGFTTFIGSIMMYIPAGERLRLIEEAALEPVHAERLKRLAVEAFHICYMVSISSPGILPYRQGPALVSGQGLDGHCQINLPA
jgi:hypothetical protein